MSGFGNESIITRMLSRIFPFSPSEKRVLILGNDNSGKTALLYQWVRGEFFDTMPTIGFNVENVLHRQISFAMWDVGGCDKIRPLWRHYFQNTQAVIYVVDSCDEERLVNPHPERAGDIYADTGLRFICQEPQLDDAIILVMANKQDVPGALSVQEISERLGLQSEFAHRHIHILGCSAKTREGIMEGLDWIHDVLLQGPRSFHPTKDEGDENGDDDGDKNLSAEEEESKRLESLLLEWLEREDLPPTEFLQRIDDATLDAWDHYTHLRIAWLNLGLYGRRNGMKRIFSMIESFIKRSPRTKRKDTSRGTTFHETMTYFWVHMVHFAMMTMQVANDSSETTSSEESIFGQKLKDDENAQTTAFKTFLLMNPQLVNGGLFLHYYSKKRMLMNAEARSSVLLPDIRSLPSILSSNSQTEEKLDSAVPHHLRLQPRAPLNDVDFIVATRGGTYGSWGHDILLRVIFIVLNQKNETDKRNLDELFEILRGVEKDNFHMTLNYFWIQMISYHIKLVAKKNDQLSSNGTGATCIDLDFETFYRQPECQKLRNYLLYEKFYSRSVIDSEDAKTSFVIPNLRQLPNVV